MTWDEKFMGVARHIAGWSKDPSTKVGAIIVGPENHEIRSTGYNGLPRSIVDDYARLNNREIKYIMIVHAEANAIFNAARIGVSTNGCIMYCSGLPTCTSCAKAIIQAGIKELVVETLDAPERWRSECDTAALMLREADVRYRIVRYTDQVP